MSADQAKQIIELLGTINDDLIAIFLLVIGMVLAITFEIGGPRGK